MSYLENFQINVFQIRHGIFVFDRIECSQTKKVIDEKTIFSQNKVYGDARTGTLH